MKKCVKNNVSWIGYIDWELKSFHGDEYSTMNGSSQNAYLIEEEKTVLIDTIWAPHRMEFVENLKKEIDLNKIDFIVANHGEADHSGALGTLINEIPDTPIYCTANAIKSIEGQYGQCGWNFHVVKTGDIIDIGNGKQLVFIEMKMLHWPDSMATYMTGDNILFSNDAFGQHFAVEGMFNDNADQCLLMREALKYYANILNPFSALVAKKIDEIKAMHVPIDIIAPSHGVVWHDNPAQIIEQYASWAANYQEDRITICYDTMYEGTARIAHEIAKEIFQQSPKTAVQLFNIAKADKNEIITEVFRSKAIAVGSPTVNNSILSSVAGLLSLIQSLKFKNKKAAVFGCYGWSGESVELLKIEMERAGFKVIEDEVKSLWNPAEEDFAKVRGLVEHLLAE